MCTKLHNYSLNTDGVTSYYIFTFWEFLCTFYFLYLTRMYWTTLILSNLIQWKCCIQCLSVNAGFFLPYSWYYLLKLMWATFENQASCSIRLHRKQLRCTLPSLFFVPARVLFCILLLSLLRPVCTKDSPWDKTVARKVTAVWTGSSLQLSLSSHQRPFSEHDAHHCC